MALPLVHFCGVATRMKFCDRSDCRVRQIDVYLARRIRSPIEADLPWFRPQPIRSPSEADWLGVIVVAVQIAE